MKNLLQSSTQEPIVFGPMVLTSDHISGNTANTPTVTISKNGAAFASPSGAVSSVGNGWWQIAGNATDTNTLGSLIVHATATSTDVFDERFEVVAFNPQDAVHLGISALPNTACTTNASLITSGTGTAQISASSGQVIIQAGTGAGQLDFTSGVVKANLAQILGSAITGTAANLASAFSTMFNVVSSVFTTASVNQTGNSFLTAPAHTPTVNADGTMQSDVRELLGTAWLTPGTAGTPDVNAKLVGGTAQTSRDLGLALPAVAPAANGGLATVDASNRIAGIQANGIGIGAFDSGSAPVVSQRVLIMSGTTTPVALNGAVLYAAGVLNGKWFYSSKTTTVSVWWSGSVWQTTSSAGSLGTWSFVASGDEQSTWTAQTGATGTLTIAAIGLPTNPNFPKLAVDSSGDVTANAVGDFTATQKTSLNAATPASVQNISAQTGDAYARIGATGSGLTSLAQAADLATKYTALMAGITNIQNNTFIASSIPTDLMLPGSGSASIQITFVFYNADGAAVNLDASANPTTTLVNDAGADKSSRLGSWTNPAIGVYQISYTNTSTDVAEGLHWLVSGTLSGNLRKLPAITQLLVSASTSFNTTDRATLNAAATAAALATAQAGITAIGTPLQAGSYVAPPTAIQNRQEMDSNSTRLATAASQETAIKAKTDLIATNPGDSPNQVTAQGEIAAIGTGSGGANAITVTITDNSANPIQGATVTIWSGTSLISTKITNSSGIAVPTANNGTYTLDVVAPGFNGTSQSLVVSAPAPLTVALAALSITPATPPECTGYLVCADAEGNIQSGISHYFRLIGTAQGGTGNSFSTQSWTVQSDGSGLVQTTFVIGSNYGVKRGVNGTESKFTATTGTFQLPSLQGQ